VKSIVGRTSLSASWLAYKADRPERDTQNGRTTFTAKKRKDSQREENI
jgi:hypothetical protein